MDLSKLDEFARQQGPKCGIYRLLDRLSEKEARAVESALRSDHAATTIMRWLSASGHQISRDTIARHRNGECSCGRRS